MKKFLLGAVLVLFATTGAYAASDAMTPQQRMKECAPLTKGMTKDQRSGFLSQCLSKKGHDAAMASKGAMSDAQAKVGTKTRKARTKAAKAAKAAEKADAKAGDLKAEATGEAHKAEKKARKTKKAAAGKADTAKKKARKAKKKATKAAEKAAQ